MESNRKITEIVENTKTHFLKGHLLKEEKFAPTTIEKEYLKKRGKKSYKAIVFLIAFVIIALATTLVLTEFMVGRNIAVVVDINSFRTLDVAEIIQNIKDNQKELRNLKLDIESRKSELEIQIELIKTRARDMISKLNINDLGKSEYRKKVDKINKQKDIDIETLIKNYETIISSTMDRINRIEEDLKKQQKNLNTKRTDIIEPSNQYIDSPITDPNTELIMQNEKYRQLINILSNEMIATRANLDLAQTSIDTLQNRNIETTNLELQIEELQRQNIQLSNQNNTNLLVKIEELESLNTQLSNEYNAYISNNNNNNNNTNTVNVVVEREQVDIIPVENIVYHRALEYLLLQKRDGAGYIINNTNNDEIDIFISSSYKITIGEKVFVFRGGSFLAELEITNNSKPLAKAKMIRSVNNGKIIPFDIILLSLK